MPDYRAEIMKKLGERFSPAIQREPAIMGLADETIETDEENVIWVTHKITGEPLKVLNRREPNKPGRLVWIGYDPINLSTRLQVLGLMDVYDSGSETIPPQLKEHAETHRRGSTDTDWVEGERMLLQAIVPVPGENKVDLYPYNKAVPDKWVGSDYSTRIDYSAHIPTSGVRVTLIVLDSAGEIAFRDGDVYNDRSQITRSQWPPLLPGDSGLGGLYLTAGMEDAKFLPGNDDIIDLRLSGAIGGSTSIASNLIVQEVDGTPSVEKVRKIIFPNGTLVEQAGNTVSVNITPTLSVYEDLSSQVDGVTDEFTLAEAAESIIVLINGLAQQPAYPTLAPDKLSFTIPDVLSTGTALAVLRNPAVGGSSVPDWVRNHPDTPPVQADAMDDEFDGTSLDAKWSEWVDPSIGSYSITVGNGALQFLTPANSGVRVCSVLQDIPNPSSTWKFRARLAVESPIWNYQGFGMVIRNSTEDKAIWLGCMAHSGFGERTGYIGFLTGYGAVSEADLVNYGGDAWYLEIEKTSTEIIWRWSTSGRMYNEMYRHAAAYHIGAAPNQVGILAHPYSWAYYGAFTCDWFRRIA